MPLLVSTSGQQLERNAAVKEGLAIHQPGDASDGGGDAGTVARERGELHRMVVTILDRILPAAPSAVDSAAARRLLAVPGTPWREGNCDAGRGRHGAPRGHGRAGDLRASRAFLVRHGISTVPVVAASGGCSASSARATSCARRRLARRPLGLVAGDAGRGAARWRRSSSTVSARAAGMRAAVVRP
ncbi:MAG: hypothetical protein U1E17_18115 [Geminicoccaceae bacterium]